MLTGKVAVVTGGARGIGAALVRALHAEGAIVIVLDVDLAEAEKVCDSLGEGAAAIKVNIGDVSQLPSTVAHIAATWGHVDILVNNAAIFDMAPVLEIEEARFDAVFLVNVKGLVFLTQAVASQMIAQGRGGKILNVASQAGQRGGPLVSTYSASKAAVISLTQSFALELIGHDINVNAIAPGVVDTPMWDQIDALFAEHEHLGLGEKRSAVANAVPAGRMGRPDDYCGAAIYLLSAASDYVVGEVLNVNGGSWVG